MVNPTSENPDVGHPYLGALPIGLLLRDWLQLKVTAIAGVDELEVEFSLKSRDLLLSGMIWNRNFHCLKHMVLPILPVLEGVGDGLTILCATGGVRVNRGGRSVDDVDMAAIRLPSGNGGCEMLVGIGDAPVVFGLGRVSRDFGCGVTAFPELLNKLIAFVIIWQREEGRALLGSYDPENILSQPLLIWKRQTL